MEPLVVALTGCSYNEYVRVHRSLMELPEVTVIEDPTDTNFKAYKDSYLGIDYDGEIYHYNDLCCFFMGGVDSSVVYDYKDFLENYEQGKSPECETLEQIFSGKPFQMKFLTDSEPKWLNVELAEVTLYFDDHQEEGYSLDFLLNPKRVAYAFGEVDPNKNIKDELSKLCTFKDEDFDKIRQLMKNYVPV